MSDLIGYVSSFFVTFGLGVGFALGGVIFLFLLTYAIMLLFKKSRLAIKEDKPRTFSPSRNRLVPIRNSQKRSSHLSERTP